MLTCSPYFHEPALHELRLHQELAPGYLLLEANIPFDQLTTPWRHRLSHLSASSLPGSATYPLR
jgi:hypothetical protein